MPTYAIKPMNDDDSYDPYPFIDASTPEIAGRQYLEEEGDAGPVRVVEVQPVEEPKDYAASIAHHVVHFYIEDQTAEDEQLGNPDWLMSWEEPGVDLNEDNRQALVDEIAAAIRRWAEKFPHAMQTPYRCVGPEVTVSALPAHDGDPNDED